MNILYVVDNWPSLFEAYLMREVRWMKRRGHRVAVVSLASVGPHAYRHETARHAELSACGVEDIPALQLESKDMSNERMIAEALSFARQHETQLIDAHFAREPAELACQIHLASGIPYAVRMRGGDAHSNTSPKLAQILEHASAVCPMSRFLADVLIGKRPLNKIPEGIPAAVSADKLRVLPISLPAKYLSNVPAAQDDEIQVIGSIGRLVPIKRFQDAVEAVAGLIDDFPGLRLLIIGGGAMESELRFLAKEAGMSNRLEITGFRSWDEVMRLASQLHIYVQPSELEGFCQATIEAAFKGIPLVLSRTGVHEECIEPGLNGYLFDVGDVKAMRESLRSLLMAGAARRNEMGRASLEIVSERFTTEKLMPRVESIFQAAINCAALPS